MGADARSGSPRARTRWPKERWRCCWKRSTSRRFMTARTAFGGGAGLLEEWFEHAVRPRMKGRGCLMRLADDLVIGCAVEADARRIMTVLPKRCARVGLRMQPSQTTRIACRKPETRKGAADGNGTFALL